MYIITAHVKAEKIAKTIAEELVTVSASDMVTIRQETRFRWDQCKVLEENIWVLQAITENPKYANEIISVYADTDVLFLTETPEN